MHATALPSPSADGTVLVTGATGFLAGFIIAALRDAGWNVLRGLRAEARYRAADCRTCDFDHPLRDDQWLALLTGVDAVVNVAGILRERRTGDFESIHHSAPLALAQACVTVGVRRFIQISALGEAFEDGEFVASKHRLDEALQSLPLDTLVLRPSVVYSASGSYGGTSLLRALAATPWLMTVPGDGQWKIQPLAAEDLARLVVIALEQPICGLFEVGGSQVLSLLDYLRQWRAWLGLPAARVVRIPAGLVTALVAVGERIGGGPLGTTSWRMLRRGNITGTDAPDRLMDAFGFQPRPLAQVLASRPSQVQDRWQAQLYLLGPLLRIGIVLLFLLSGWVGLTTPAEAIARLTEGSILQSIAPVQLARVAAVCDLLLGMGLLIGRGSRGVLVAMLLLVGAYTLIFGLLLPSQWLDPLGGLAKNLVVLPALAVLWVLAEQR